MKEDGATENEYDVVSVALKGDKDVEVWVRGVTTEQNLSAKRTADLGKIQKLKDLLGGRWEADVRVVTCYVHRDGNDICLEIICMENPLWGAPCIHGELLKLV